MPVSTGKANSHNGCLPRDAYNKPVAGVSFNSRIRASNKLNPRIRMKFHGKNIFYCGQSTRLGLARVTSYETIVIAVAGYR